ncbi:hypothetical protein ACFVAD_14365 [Sutcliffiella sp. NPDC057660]
MVVSKRWIDTAINKKEEMVVSKRWNETTIKRKRGNGGLKEVE